MMVAWTKVTVVEIEGKKQSDSRYILKGKDNNRNPEGLDVRYENN